ncbi:hypothetical protein QR680_015514 [Steinernema hermaphroditum]|uniref:E3 ubiquitin-protein ligase n=1 Tax=Steinernema hermaphroditum TaxID=289476 RepID=A0AA39LKZ6_9BILA|nr:hypothetical protein QR680_015514 [Steinernema hermaphroditum]
MASADMDHDVILQLLQFNDDPEMQITALEHFCMASVGTEASQNPLDFLRLFRPRLFVPALAVILKNPEASLRLLEATTRAFTYYMELDAGVTDQLSRMDDVLQSLNTRLATLVPDSRLSKDTMEQIIKLYDEIARINPRPLYRLNALTPLMGVVCKYADVIYHQRVDMALTVIFRICQVSDPKDEAIVPFARDLTRLLTNTNLKIVENAMKCLTMLVTRFIQKNVDPFKFIKSDNVIENVLNAATLLPDGVNPTVVRHVSQFFVVLYNGPAVVVEEALSCTRLVPFLKTVCELGNDLVLECSRVLSHLVILTSANGYRKSELNFGSPLLPPNREADPIIHLKKSLTHAVLCQILPLVCHMSNKVQAERMRYAFLTYLARSVDSATIDILKAVAESEEFKSDLLSTVQSGFANDEDYVYLEVIFKMLSALVHKRGAVWKELIVRNGLAEKIESISKKPLTLAVPNNQQEPAPLSKSAKSEAKVKSYAEKLWKAISKEASIAEREAVKKFDRLCGEVQETISNGNVIETNLLQKFTESVASGQLTNYELSRSQFVETVGCMVSGNAIGNTEVSMSLLSTVINRIIQVLEAVENFTSNKLFESRVDIAPRLGMSVFISPQRASDNEDLVDLAPKKVMVEMLATVEQLRSTIISRVRPTDDDDDDMAEEDEYDDYDSMDVEDEYDGEEIMGEEGGMGQPEHGEGDGDSFEEYADPMPPNDEEVPEPAGAMERAAVPPPVAVAFQPHATEAQGAGESVSMHVRLQDVLRQSAQLLHRLDEDTMRELLDRHGAVFAPLQDSGYFQSISVRRKYDALSIAANAHLTGRHQHGNHHLRELNIGDIISRNIDAEHPSTSEDGNAPIHLALKVKGPNGFEKTVVLDHDECTVFFALKEVVFKSVQRTMFLDEYKYTLIYSSSPIAGESLKHNVKQTKNTASREDSCHESLKEILDVLRLLNNKYDQLTEFTSQHLDRKVAHVLSDPLVVVGDSLPQCLDTRLNHLRATAFGPSRSVVWVQQSQSQSRNRRYIETKYVLKEERIKVARGNNMLASCILPLFQFHAERKAMLDVVFDNEEATGIGPTRELYGITATELQRSELAMWHCDESTDDNNAYVNHPGGLFPAPVPASDTNNLKYFAILGTVLAKALQDGHLVDLPLSLPFLKILVNGCECRDGMLTLNDMMVFHPTMATFLKQLEDGITYKRSSIPQIEDDALILCHKGSASRVDDLGLVFAVNAPSRHFSTSKIDLILDGSKVALTGQNAEQYVEACKKVYLCDGIKAQIAAFRAGFNKVFPVECLRRFTPAELMNALCGERNTNWSREDLINNTVASNGYTRDHPTFQQFVDVLLAITPAEKSTFLHFATGCSTLPPGGFANLKPPLTVVKRVDSGDNSYPSVNTCKHFIKLPEYSSADILRQQLLTAIKVEGFQMN